MLDFPDSPSDGEQSTQPNGITYQWDATLTRWTSVLSLGAGIVAGTVVQVQNFQRQDVVTLGVIDPDGSTPQITDGVEILSLAYTPKYASSQLRIDVSALMGIASGDIGFLAAALFEDAGPDALAAAAQFEDIGTAYQQTNFTFFIDAASTNARTYSVRAGSDTGGQAYLNGTNVATQVYNGTEISSLTITEIQPNAVTVNSSNDFDNKLAGYADTGLHTQFTGDLNTINVNSTYNFQGDQVTNKPDDMVSVDWGFITTYTFFLGSTNSAQVIVGMANGNEYKMWMRHEATTVWGDWKLVVDGGAFTQRLSGYLDTGLAQNYSGNLNDIGINSMFNFDASSVTNEPADMAVNGNIVTLKHSNALYGQQVIYGALGADAGKQWQRPLDNGVWGAWKLVVDGDSPSKSLFCQTIGSSGVTSRKNKTGPQLSCNRSGPGIYAYTISPALPNDAFNIQATVLDADNARPFLLNISASSFGIRTRDASNVTIDASHQVLITYDNS